MPTNPTAFEDVYQCPECGEMIDHGEPHQDPMRNRRLRRVVLCQGEVLRSLGQAMHRWCRLSGLPTDAETVFVHYDVANDQWQLLIRSDEFSIIEPGALVPVIDLMMETREECN
jgi:hypothetical protein